MRAALRTLTSPPWRRAPILLLGRPGVLAPLAGAAAVLAAAVAAVPLFLSSTGSEALAVQAGERCPTHAGAEVVYVNLSGPRFNPPRVTPILDGGVQPSDLPSDPFADLRGLVDRRRTLVLDTAVDLRRADAGAGAGSETVVVRLMARDGAVDHLEAVGEQAGEGAGDGREAWLSDRAADVLAVSAGDRVAVELPIGADFGGEPTPVVLDPVPVAGVYRDLAGYELDDHWCAVASTLSPEADGDLPPPLVLVDTETILDVANANGTNQLGVYWEASLAADDLTVASAGRLRDRLACVAVLAGRGVNRDEVTCPEGPIAIGLEDVGEGVTLVPESIATDLPFMVDRSRSIRRAVGGGVVPVAGFAALAGVGLVGAAAVLWFDRRRREVTLLTTRGVGPVAIGTKAVLELLVAAAVGAVAGFGLAYGAVRWLGPSPTVEPAAVRQAAVGGVVALLLALVTIGTVVAARARAHESLRRRPGRLAWVPWELVLGAATVVSYLRLGSWGTPVSRGAGVSRVDLLGLMFPVLFLATGVAVSARLMTVALGPLRSASRRWPTALYLAVRRVATARSAAVGLVAAAAIAAGVLGYAATLTRSLNETLEVKARTFIGSDLAVRLFPNQEVPPSLADRSTEVDVYDRARIVDNGERAYVLAVDTATFARAAFWDSSYAGASLDDLLDRLAERTPDGRVPALFVGDGFAEDDVAVVALERRGDSEVEVERIATPAAFPGMETHRPTVVVATSALGEVDAAEVTELWVRGDPDATFAALAADGTGFRTRRNVTDVVDQVSFLTVSWTFGFLQSLGIVAGVLALGGLTVYLDARRRSQVLGYSFARRMGLARSTHRRALLVEMVATVVVGCWLGLGISLVGAWLAHDRLDPVPRLPPGPVLRVASGVVVLLAVVAAVVAGVGAVLAQRRTDRDDPVEVIRAGT